MICELLFPSSILAVKLNRKTLVIVLEVEIYIYDISNMRLLHVIETTPNPEGALTLCIGSHRNLIHVPCSDCCAFAIRGDFLPRIPLSSALPSNACTTKRDTSAHRFDCFSGRRRYFVLNALTHSCERDTSS